MQKRTWLLVGGVVVVVAAVVAIAVAASSGGSHHASGPSGSTTSTTRGHPGSTAAGSTPPEGGSKPTNGGKPVHHSGAVTAATGAGYGQAASGGTCAHFTERFVNRTDAEVVSITFAPSAAEFSAGTAGAPGYRTWKADTPAPAAIAVKIAPGHDQDMQFMVCTTTQPPNGATSVKFSPPTSLQWKWSDGAAGKGAFPA